MSSAIPLIECALKRGQCVVRSDGAWDLRGIGLVAVLMLVHGGRQLLAQSPPISFQYVYDDRAQLVRVVDSAGNEIEYTYDAAGNIVAVIRKSVAPGSLLIWGVTPQQGHVGDVITIRGQSFAGTTGANVVKFNGTPGEVLTATPSALTVMVPSGATVGRISVSVGSVTAMSGADFIVVHTPLITTLSHRSALFNAVIPNLVVRGADLAGATFSFGTPSLTVTAAAPNPDGTSASLSLTVGTLAGTFPLVATNAFGSSELGMTATNSFTVVNPSSANDGDGDGFPDALEVLFGSDPSDPLSVPDPDVLRPTAVVAQPFSIVNAGGGPANVSPSEAAALPFSTFNLAGLTGGAPITFEVRAPEVYVVNMDIDAPLSASLEPGGPPAGGGVAVTEADAIGFSVNNLAPNAPPPFEVLQSAAVIVRTRVPTCALDLWRCVRRLPQPHRLDGLFWRGERND